jgi:hypothetical protein
MTVMLKAGISAPHVANALTELDAAGICATPCQKKVPLSLGIRLT